MRRLAVALAVVSLGGCGDERPRLTVSAASSLGSALSDYARGFDAADVKLSLAGSDALAAQIRSGVRPDVFVSADAGIVDALHDDGLGGPAQVVATNRLVLAVPADEARVRSLADLARPGITLAVGSASVPIGAYTQEALRRLREGRRILAHVRTREPDVAGVVGKIAAGAVDAGFVYATDVRAAKGRLRAVALPARIQPRIEYAATVLEAGDEARRFVAGLPAALRGAGFGAP